MFMIIMTEKTIPESMFVPFSFYIFFYFFRNTNTFSEK